MRCCRRTRASRCCRRSWRHHSHLALCEHAIRREGSGSGPGSGSRSSRRGSWGEFTCACTCHVSMYSLCCFWAATYGALARPPSRQPMIPELHAGQWSAHPARGRGRGRLHWSPRKSPRDIFSTFLFLGAAQLVSHGSSNLTPCRAGQKSRRRRLHGRLSWGRRAPYP